MRACVSADSLDWLPSMFACASMLPTCAMDLEHGLPLLVSGAMDDRVPGVARVVHQNIQLSVTSK